MSDRDIAPRLLGIGLWALRVLGAVIAIYVAWGLLAYGTLAPCEMAKRELEQQWIRELSLMDPRAKLELHGMASHELDLTDLEGAAADSAFAKGIADRVVGSLRGSNRSVRCFRATVSLKVSGSIDVESF